MIRRRTLVGLIVIAAAVLAIVVISGLLSPETDEEESLATDVAVHTGTVIRTTLHRYVTAYGTVEPEPPSDGRPPASAFIGSPVSGILTQINCSEGQRITKGALLFRLDSRTAEAALLKAKKQLVFAEQTYARQKELLDVEGTSLKSFQEAESRLNAARSDLSIAQTQISLLQIEAPLTGTLVKINVDLGQTIESNTTLAEILDLDRLIVAADIPSREAPLLKVGQIVELDAKPSQKGILLFVSRDIDPETDTIAIRASIPEDVKLQPGHFLDIRVVCDEHPDCLAVPEDSYISSEEEGSWIMVVQGDRAARLAVEGGFREKGLVEIKGAGLTEGMIIVTEEAYSLPPETKIHVIR